MRAVPKRLLMFTIGGLAIASSLWFGITTLQHKKILSRIQEQDLLAHREGIPTNRREMDELLPKVAAVDDAYPLYWEIQKTYSKSSKGKDMYKSIPAEKLPEYLTAFSKELELFQNASQKKGARWSKDWNQGAAVLFPELAPLKGLTKLICQRASMHSKNGRHSAAITDYQMVRKVITHLLDQPVALTALVAQSLLSIEFTSISNDCLKVKDKQPYLQELTELVNVSPHFDSKKFLITEYIDVTTLIETCETKEGRESLGISESDVAPANKLFTLLFNQNEARISIRRALIEKWQALKRPENEQSAAIEIANQKLFTGLLAFPTASKIYSSLIGSETPLSTAKRFEARDQAYRLIIQALTPSTIPKAIDTSKLINPFSEKPIKYSFDGKHIKIEYCADESDVSDTNPQVIYLPKLTEREKQTQLKT